jgi:hypothetical protein
MKSPTHCCILRRLTMIEFSATLEWADIEGTATVGRAGPKDEKGYLTTIDVVGDRYAEVQTEVDVRLTREDWGVKLSIGQYHLKGHDDERYHVKMEAWFDFEEIAALRDYLTLILRNKDLRYEED